MASPERRRLRRSATNRVLGGVLGGIADEYGLGATPLRIAYVALSVLSAAFPGILVYLLLWWLIPADA